MTENFWMFLLKCFYLMLPAYFANMAPVIFKRISFLSYPVDFNKKLGNKPIFGKNKTFRGFFFGIIIAVIISYIQFLLYQTVSFGNISFFNYSNWIAFGILMGFGALFGDLVKSFFKRRAGINPGDKLIPFDQTDFVIGGLIFVIPVISLTWKIFLTCLILSFILHIIVNHIAFYLKIRNEKW